MKELSAMMDEMTVSVEGCLESIPRDAQPDSGESGGGKHEKSICQGVQSRFSFLVDELQEAFHPEQEPELTPSDVSWLSGILRECRENPPAAATETFQKNGEIRTNPPVNPPAERPNIKPEEEIYGQKKRSWKFRLLPESASAQHVPEAPAGVAEEAPAEAVTPKPEKQKAAKKRARRQSATVQTAKKEKTGKTLSKKLLHTMTAGVMAGVCLILGVVGTEGYVQRHFVSTLESTFQGKVRYSAMDSSLSRMTVAMENTEMTFGATENDLAEGKTRAGIQVEKAVFRLDPYALAKGRVVVQDALMEGMQFSSPEAYLNESANQNAVAQTPSWSLTPLLSPRCDAEIEQQLAALASVKYFQDMKAHYVPRYKELARRSQEINQELAVLRQQVSSRMGEENLEGLVPAGMPQINAAEGLSALAPHDSSVRLASYDAGADTKNRAAGQWGKDDENVTYLVQAISRLMHLRQESEKIYAECAGLKQEISGEMQKVQAKVAEDGKTFQPYLEPPVLDEKLLAEAFFAEDSTQKAQEMTAWLEMLQQVVAGGLQRELTQKTAQASASADVNARFGSAAAKKNKKSAPAITVQRAATSGNVTLFGQKFLFSGDWKTVSAEGGDAAGAPEKLEAEITLTPARLAGFSPESVSGKIHFVMEEDAGRVKKHIRAEFPVHQAQECCWAANSLPVKAVPESAVVRMSLTCLDDELHGQMELKYRDVTLASVATPALASHAWEGRIQDWKADTLEVSVKFTGQRHTPRAQCQALGLAALLPVYTQALAELHDARKDHVAGMFHQKLVDTEDSFHGAIQPVYEQISLKTGNIAHLQDGLQTFLVRNMKPDTPAAETHTPLYGEPDFIPVRQEHYAIAAPGYAVVNGKTYYTSSPQPQPAFANDYSLDAPVFNPEWSEISGAVGSNAGELLETHTHAAAQPPVLPPPAGAVQVPVRKMTVQERDGVLILSDSPIPAQTYVPTYAAPAPTDGEVFHDGDHAPAPAEDPAIRARKSETDTSSLFRKEMTGDTSLPSMPVYQAEPAASSAAPSAHAIPPAPSSAARKGAPLPIKMNH